MRWVDDGIEIFLTAVALVGCSSTPPSHLPQGLEQSSEQLRVKTEATAKILVIQRLASGTSCDKVRGDVSVTIKSDASGDNIPTETSCTLVPSSLVLRTVAFLPKGNYNVHVSLSSDPKRYVGKPFVTSDCEDPEVNSGPDQDFIGAQPLEENQTIKGKVNFANGNATSWVKLNGKGGATELLLLADAPTNLHARLFVLPKGARVPRRLDALAPKVKKYMKPADGTLYVQITGQKYQGEVNFTLTRRDSVPTKTVNVPVIDLYPLNANSSIVLLKPSESLKVNDELQISAKKSGGGFVVLGKCVVSSVSDSQVSCRMSAVPAADLGQYRAQLMREDGNT